VNIVTGPEHQGQAVLIRAIEPIDGIEIMMKHRKLHHSAKLTNGPAKLTQAMGISRSIDGTNIFDGPLHLEPGFKPKEITAAPRIGITKAKDNPWRFYVEGNPFVSRTYVKEII
jgi:DNA-3-methyladenine glycosylase